MMKCLLRSLAVLLIFLIVWVTVFLTSQAGLKTAFRITQALAPGSLSVSSLHGTLTGEIKLTGLSYQSKTLSINLQSLEFDWSPSALLAGRLKIDKLHADNVSIQTTTQVITEPVTKKSSPGLPRFTPPIAITLNDAIIKHISYQQNENEPSKINQITLAFHTKGHTFFIQQFHLIADPTQVSLAGNLELAPPYAMALRGNITTKNLLLETLTGNFVAEGDLKKTLKASFTSSVAKRFDVYLVLQRALSDTGTIDFTGQWEKLNLSLNPDQLIHSRAGSFSLRGPLNHYQANLETSFTAIHIPETQVKLQGFGSLKSFTLENGRIQLLDGEILTNGTLTFLPSLAWDLHLITKHLNPGRQWADLKGDINFTLHTQGQQHANSLNASLQVNGIHGTFKAQALSGNINLAYDKDTLTLHTLDLTLGQNTLWSQGTLGRDSQISWRIHLPDLSQVYSIFSGKLISSGTLTGNYQRPQINLVALTANKLSLPNLHIGTLNAKGFLDTSFEKNSDLVLDATRLHYQGFRIDQLHTSFKGDLEKHHWYINLRAREEHFYLDTYGTLTEKNLAESITQFRLNTKKHGDWRLDRPISLTISPTHVAVSPFCWRRDQQHYICGKGDWDTSNTWQNSLTIRKFDLGLFNVFLPKKFNLSSNIDTDLRFSGEGEKSSVGQLALMIHQLVIKVVDINETHILTLVNSSVKAQATPEGLLTQTQLFLYNTRNQLTLHLDFPHYHLFNPMKPRQKIKGHLNIAVNDLNQLIQLAPLVTDIKGVLRGNFAIEGTVETPKLKGSLNLVNGIVTLKTYGLVLTNLMLNLAIKNEKLTLDGSVRSGNGTLHVQGDSDLKQFLKHADIHVFGSNITVINNKEYHVIVSPDLKITYLAPDLNITGTILVPFAKLTPNDFSSAITLPSNFVIIREDSEERPFVLETYIQVRVILGDQINLTYGGLQATLGGNMLITSKPRAEITAIGKIFVKKGNFQAYGKQLDITKGDITFTGGAIENPALDILALKTIPVYNLSAMSTSVTGSIAVGVQVLGTADQPKIALYSVPTLSQSDILSYLLFDRPSNAVGQDSSALVGQALAMLAAGHTAGFASNIQDSLGLSSIGLESTQVYVPGQSAAQSTTAFVVGKQLTKRLEALYTAGISLPVMILMLRYQISNHWQLQTQTSNFENAADIMYTIESG